jgi:hypothetical protein
VTILVFYKCRWCARTFEEKTTLSKDPEDAVKAAPKLMLHDCDGDDEIGRTGVADLLGARRERA